MSLPYLHILHDQHPLPLYLRLGMNCSFWSTSQLSSPPPLLEHTLGPDPPNALLVGRWGVRMPRQHTSIFDLP